MLRELHISNLAVIEDAAVELTGGLNCFTGQTGAGKSLILGAFSVLLGMRSAADLLRAGAEEGRVSGVFELRDAETIRRVNELGDLDLDATGEHEQLLVTRKLFASGRTSVSINGRPATASMLRAIGQHLVDVHGQHDHQFLLKPANQLLMLDRFAGCEDLRARFADLHHRLRELRGRREELEASRTLRDQQLELHEFQADEIDRAEPTGGEYEEVAARHRLLSNLGKVRSEAGAAHAALYETDGAILDRLQAITGVLRELGELDEELAPIVGSIREAAAQLQDASFDLGRYVNRIDLDPAELEEVTDRLNTLNRLIHKYGPGRGGSLDDVLEHREHIQVAIERLRSESGDLSGIDEQIEPLRREMMEVGERLSERRREAAARLRPLVEGQLAELGMAEAKLEAAFERLDERAGDGEGASGLDAVELLVQTNPGQPARPLRKVASGGELSRIMLAIKSIAAEADRVSVLVFDEIDANIGGRMGTVIGEKLRRLAAHHQVLCITHLPQIAAFADQHLKITKSVEAGETRTRVDRLADTARTDELAEMLTGKHATATTRKQAGEMLRLAESGATDGETDRRTGKGGKKTKRRGARRTAETRSG